MWNLERCLCNLFYFLWCTMMNYTRWDIKRRGFKSLNSFSIRVKNFIPLSLQFLVKADNNNNCSQILREVVQIDENTYMNILLKYLSSAWRIILKLCFYFVASLLETFYNLFFLKKGQSIIFILTSKTFSNLTPASLWPCSPGQSIHPITSSYTIKKHLLNAYYIEHWSLVIIFSL